MHIHRKRMIVNLVGRGVIILLIAMAASAAIVSWMSADLPSDLYRRSILAALLIPMLISPPISLGSGPIDLRRWL